jgi:hypothetical protein
MYELLTLHSLSIGDRGEASSSKYGRSDGRTDGRASRGRKNMGNDERGEPEDKVDRKRIMKGFDRHLLAEYMGRVNMLN